MYRRQRTNLPATSRAILGHEPRPKHPEEVLNFLAELHRLCALYGRDFAIYVALAVNETDWFTHIWWDKRLNPASIGVTGVPSQDQASPTFENGTKAARCLFLLLEIKLQRVIPLALAHYAHIAPAKTTETLQLAGLSDFPEVRTLQDLHAKFGPNLRECVWACSPANAVSIMEKARALWPKLKDQTGDTMAGTITTGRVPQPHILQYICPKPFEGAGFTRLSSPRVNVGVCEHITDGHGSVEFYRDFFSTGGERATDALVDFIVGRDGRIAMLNDWRGTRAPWANGNSAGMEGDGPAFYQEFGVAGINNRLVSIEHEGFPGEAWTPAQWFSSVRLDAWLFDQMGVHWDSFPVHQDHGVVTHLLHREFTNKGGNGPDECPGSWFTARVSPFQSEVRAVMREHQVGVDQGEPAPETKAKPFPEFDHGLKTRTDQHGKEGQLYEYLERRFTVAKGRKAQKRVAIGKDALIVDVLRQGEQIVSAFLTRIDDLDWIVDQQGYSYQANAFNPKFTLPIREHQQP